MNTENDVITLVEETKPAKEKKKRTYEQQKERIKAYLKNRYENDVEFRNKINNKRLINSNLKYNTDEEYRLKKLEYMKNNRKSKKEVEQNNTDTLQDDIKKLEDMLTNTNNFNLKDVSTAKMLYDKIIKQNPNYNKKMI
jgi:hypothetical protein